MATQSIFIHASITAIISEPFPTSLYPEPDWDRVWGNVNKGLADLDRLAMSKSFKG